MDGGYYKYNISSDLSVLVINSIYFSIKNTVDLATATTQLTWLQTQLSNTGSGRYILSMHIPPSLFSFLTVDDFWQDTYKQQFLSIVTTYQSKIVAILGAHIH